MRSGPVSTADTSMQLDKEHRLLDIISRRDSPSQRQVARETGLSLGMVNLVLRRLAKTGYVKVAALNGKTVRYVLTPKGSAELARRSYEYMLHVVSSFGELRDGIGLLVADLHAEGKRRFVIYGDGDVADIAELAGRLQALEGLAVVRQTEGVLPAGPEVAVLDCRLGVPPDERAGIDVLGHLSRHGA